ncbi:hypothetical protein H310_04746 [Aphanomyces invadans]|nr:hypothetical protein H310_04746 [Aphanomyces invadans]ETW04482.1 hypothetical protein H310_04746 [Aphanomyces invadans]|eukprot:XP_008867438.1 hypothetical protein H310_04746 [Aphanomyces invadans]
MSRPAKRPLVVLVVATAAAVNVAHAQPKADMSCMDKLAPVLNGLRTNTKAKACVKAVVPETPPSQLSFIDLPSNRTEVIRRMANLDECKVWYAELHDVIRATKPSCVYWYNTGGSFNTSTYNFTLTEYMDLIEWSVTTEYKDPTTKPILNKPVNTTPLPGPTTTVDGPRTSSPVASQACGVLLMSAVVIVVAAATSAVC